MQKSKPKDKVPDEEDDDLFGDRLDDVGLVKALATDLLQLRSRAGDCSIKGRLLYYVNKEVSSGIAISGLA
jgi:hypothetical protein